MNTVETSDANVRTSLPLVPAWVFERLLAAYRAQGYDEAMIAAVQKSADQERERRQNSSPIAAI